MRTTRRLRVGGEKTAATAGDGHETDEAAAAAAGHKADEVAAAGDGHETDEIAAVGVRRTVDTKAVAKAVAGEAARLGWAPHMRLAIGKKLT